MSKTATNRETELAYEWLTDYQDDLNRYLGIGSEDIRNLELTLKDDVLAMAPECYGLPHYLMQHAIDAIDFEQIAKQIMADGGQVR